MFNCDTISQRMDDNPILRDEPDEGKKRLGHIITVNWAADSVQGNALTMRMS